MFWTLELASYLEDAPWPATKDELIDYSIRSGAPIEVVENLQELEDEGEVYEVLKTFGQIIPHRKISFSTRRILKTSLEEYNATQSGGFFYVPAEVLQSSSRCVTHLYVRLILWSIV
jgi:hypothetical protein